MSSENQFVKIGNKKCALIEEEDHIRVEIVKDVFVLLDKEDKHVLEKYKWRQENDQIIAPIETKNCRLARVLLDKIDAEGFANHVNEDSLDNRKSNLVFVKRTQMLYNNMSQKGNSFVYRNRNHGYVFKMIGFGIKSAYAEEDAFKKIVQYIKGLYARPSSHASEMENSQKTPSVAVEIPWYQRRPLIHTGANAGGRAYNLWQFENESKETMLIEVADGVDAKVSFVDYDKIKNHTWFQHASGYIHTSSKNGEKRKSVIMHRHILGLTDEKVEVDHINRIRLDNRSCNLRVVTHQKNMCNKKLYKINTSGVNGIRRAPNRKAYLVRMQHNNTQIQKYFSFGSQSLMNQQEAFEAAVAYRKKLNEQYDCTNGCEPQQNEDKCKESVDPVENFSNEKEDEESDARNGFSNNISNEDFMKIQEEDEEDEDDEKEYTAKIELAPKPDLTDDERKQKRQKVRRTIREEILA